MKEQRARNKDEIFFENTEGLGRIKKQEPRIKTKEKSLKIPNLLATHTALNILRLFVDKYHIWRPGKLPYLAMPDISPDSGGF